MNAYSLTKDELFEMGLERSSEFLTVNGLEQPSRVKNGSLHSPHKPKGSYGCGMYVDRFQTVVVDAAACARPAQGVCMAWSFPTYAVDRTPTGVVAHEFGHHVDMVLDYPTRRNKEWLVLCKREKITSYEPYPWEAFAESLRVFILNPHLLAGMAPNRFAFLTQELGLVRSTTKRYRTLLSNLGASDNILRMADKKAKFL